MIARWKDTIGSVAFGAMARRASAFRFTPHESASSLKVPFGFRVQLLDIVTLTIKGLLYESDNEQRDNAP